MLDFLVFVYHKDELDADVYYIRAENEVLACDSALIAHEPYYPEDWNVRAFLLPTNSKLHALHIVSLNLAGIGE